MAMHAEGFLTKQIAAWLKECQGRGDPLFWEHRSGSGGFAYKEGIPDLFIVVGKYHIEVELKAPGGRRSAMQDKWKRRFEAMGVPYVCPTSLDELKSYLIPYINLARAEAQSEPQPELHSYGVEVHPNWGYSRPNVIPCKSEAEANELFDSVSLGGVGNVVRVLVRVDGKATKVKALEADGD